MEFPRFLKDINKYTITIEFQNKDKETVDYDFIYEIFEFELLDNQDKEYVKRLKNSGVKLKPIKRRVLNIENQKFEIKTVYYKLYSNVRKSNAYIYNRVQQVLNKKIVVNGVLMTNGEYLTMQAVKDIPKRKKTPLNNKWQLALNTIGTYLCHRTGSNIPVDLKLEDEFLSEVPIDELEEYYRIKRDKKVNRRKLDNKQKHKRWEHRHKKQMNKWRLSNTYKHDKLYKKFNLDYWNNIGLINPDVNMKKEWVYIDTENNFRFDNKTFRIQDDLEQYKVESKSGNVVDYLNKSQMDHVLGFYMPDKKEFKFFDENVEEITDYVEMVQ